MILWLAEAIDRTPRGFVRRPIWQRLAVFPILAWYVWRHGKHGALWAIKISWWAVRYPAGVEAGCRQN